MKVAIIGASGFIGARLVERLHLGGRAAVVAVVRRPSSLALPARFAVDLRLADALDGAAVGRALEGCDAVVHAALGDPAQIERMPAALAAGAAAAGVRRVVYLSSASVHGQNPAPGSDESSPLETGQALDYNNAKVRAERRFFAACARHGLAGFALRPGVVYGPRSRWIADLADELLEGRAWLYAEGRGICNAIAADNLVDAVEACLRAPAAAAGPYLVGDAETITWADFQAEATRHLGAPARPVHGVTRLPAFRRSWPDRAGRAVGHPWVQRIMPLVPDGLKRGAKAVLAASVPPRRADSWALPPPPAPRITQEMALLQQCAWKFPQRRATEALGYRPSLSFREAMALSFAWWHFARSPLPPLS